MAQDGDTELNKEIITRFIAPSFPKNCCTAISQAFLTQNKHVCLTRGLTLNRSGIDRAFYSAAALSKSKSYIECQSMTSLRVSHLNLNINIQLLTFRPCLSSWVLALFAIFDKFFNIGCCFSPAPAKSFHPSQVVAVPKTWKLETGDIPLAGSRAPVPAWNDSPVLCRYI